MSEKFAVTAEGLEELKRELEELEGVARPEIVERIKIAREWGDLKENSEYHDAKNSQAMLERKITIIRARIDNAVVIDPAEAGDHIQFGTTAVVVDLDTEREYTYQLVGESEADMKLGKISNTSPVGRALLGKSAGEIALIETPRGSRRMEIKSISH